MSVVTWPTGPGVRNAPSNEPAGDGVVKYISSNSESAARSRKAEAHEKMAALCKSKYKIIKEESRPLSDGERRQFHQVITFQCEG